MLPSWGLLLYVLSTLRLANTASYVQHQILQSLPGVFPVSLNVVLNELDPADNDLIFVSPYGTASDGLYIYRNDGELVWINTAETMTDGNVWSMNNLHVVEYQGQPHLAANFEPLRGKEACGVGMGKDMFALSTIPPGGANVLFNDRYEMVRLFPPPAGSFTDPHEFDLLDNGTTVVRHAVRKSFVSPYDAGKQPNRFDTSCLVHVLNEATDETIFEWDASDFVSPEESCRRRKGLHSPHLNSIDRLDDGHWMLNNYFTCSTIKVNATTGAIIWRFGGPIGDFKMTDGTYFSMLHHVRHRSLDEIYLPPHIERSQLSSETHLAISFYDNAWNSYGPPTSPSASAVVVLFDLRNMTGQVIERYYHPDGKLSPIFGSVQFLSNGNRFVGWGQSGEISEFNRHGKLVYHAGLDMKGEAYALSYRAYKAPWAAMPAAKPDVLSYSWTCETPTRVYVSWNGATDVEAFRVLTAEDKMGIFTEAKTVPKDGFETAIRLDRFIPYVVVEVLGRHGRVLSKSEVTRVKVPSDGMNEHCQMDHCPVKFPKLETLDRADECLSGSEPEVRLQYQTGGMRCLGACGT